MPEQVPAAAPPAPGGAGGQPSQQPPFGQPGASQGSPNRGFEAAGLQRLGLAVRMLEQLVPLLGSSSEPGKVVMETITKLAKFVPAGSVTPAAQKSQIEQMQQRQMQANQQMQMLAQQRQQQGGGAPGAPGTPGASPMAQPRAA